jgi:hypothetical protein
MLFCCNLLGLPSGRFARDIITRIPCAFRVSSSQSYAHVTLLDFTALAVLREPYKSRSTSLCNIVYFPLLHMFHGHVFSEHFVSNIICVLSNKWLTTTTTTTTVI